MLGSLSTNLNPMSKRTLIVCLVMIGCANLVAQEDKKAKDILNKLSTKTKAYSSIKTDFSYSLVNKDRKINTTQNWKLILKGDRYRLDMGDQLIISDGKTLWKILKNDKEVEISIPAGGDESLNPRNIFTMYEKGFKFKYVKEEKLGTKTVHTIDLFPVNPKEKDYNSIRLYIDKAALQVVKSEIRGKNGNMYTYNIKKFTTNEAVDAAQLSYKTADFPGFEVNDLR
jgi:outer membrane lipoprotein-sorting protein